MELTDDQKRELSFKILNGLLLTEAEFHAAYEAGYFVESEGQKATYASYKLLHYEDDEIRGMLCVDDGKINVKHHRRGYNFTTGRGEKLQTFGCLFGVHREDVKPEYLTEEQKRLW